MEATAEPAGLAAWREQMRATWDAVAPAIEAAFEWMRARLAEVGRWWRGVLVPIVGRWWRHRYDVAPMAMNGHAYHRRLRGSRRRHRSRYRLQQHRAVPQ